MDRHARLRAIRDVAPAIREFVLRPEATSVETYAIGSHVNVGVLIDGRPETRCYSLVGETSAPTATGSRFGARPTVAAVRSICGRCSRARAIEISSPASLFEIDWTRRSYCLIAGGIGITPIIGIAGMLKRRNAAMELHYAVTSRRDAAFLDELSDMLGDRLIVHASDEANRIDLDDTFRRLPPNSSTILCGPLRLLEAARRSWTSAGRAPADLRYETFGSSGLLPTESFRVRIDRSGREIVVPENKSLLDALNEAGFEVISDCQRGECGVCAIDVVAVDGKIDHRDVFFSDHQKGEGGKICPCVSRAVGAITVNTLYQSDGG